jgi:hypothetical protein
VRITKVVVLFTRNPTKYVLQFSEFSKIFYTFYKFLQNCNTIEDALLRRDPVKIQGHAIGSLDHGRRRRRSNSSESAALPAGEAVGHDHKLT